MEIQLSVYSAKGGEIERSKGPAYFIFDSCRIFWGFLKGSFTGVVSDNFRRSMIRLFCVTSGVSSDFIAWVATVFRPRMGISKFDGVLGAISTEDLSKAGHQLKQDGFFVFPQRLSSTACEELQELSLKIPGLRRPTDDEVRAGAKRRVEGYFDPKNPACVRFDYDAKELLKSETVQKLICDPLILALAESYVGPSPILDIVTMWWSCQSDKPDDQAAQMFHYDMENFRWIKFFFYITDVTEKNGPHIFVRGTHKPGGLPIQFREQIYVRFSDAKVDSAFSKSDQIVFTGPRGTILAEDTRGLHKGQAVEAGARLLFQLQFSASKLLTVDADMVLPAKIHPTLENAIERYPTVYQKLKRH